MRVAGTGILIKYHVGAAESNGTQVQVGQNHLLATWAIPTQSLNAKPQISTELADILQNTTRKSSSFPTTHLLDPCTLKLAVRQPRLWPHSTGYKMIHGDRRGPEHRTSRAFIVPCAIERAVMHPAVLAACSCDQRQTHSENPYWYPHQQKGGKV